MSRCVVAGISLVDAAVVLDNVVLDFFPELLHGALGVFMVGWRSRTGLVGGVQSGRGRGGSSG